MTDFKAKMHQIRFRLGLRPRPRWGAYTALPQTPLLDFGAASRQGAGLGKRRGRGGMGKWRRGKGRAPSYCRKAPQSLATPL